ncbi:FAD-dependent oxidoreductase, partial [Candidatus Sumerlaeota bacterium]|nr:FAD-dependent oxidoreductase [Candidatus Sumerlaeota bacterium]
MHELSPPPYRESQLESLGNTVFDVLVVGGGISGVTAAHELTRRGYVAALIDNHDFASGTSQESSQMIWGGIKYLQGGHVKLVNKLCLARNRLVRAYADRVSSLRFLYPHFDHDPNGLLTIMAGTYAYFVLGRGFGRLPRRLTAEAIHRLIPALALENFRYGIAYTDARMTVSDARMTLDILMDAMAAGLTAANYVDLEKAAWNNAASLYEIQAADRRAQSPITIRAKWIVNTTGVWVDEINRLLDLETPHRLCFSKGIHLIVPKIETSGRAITCLAKDGRILFVVPWGEVTQIGTTDTPFDEPPRRVRADQEDIDYLREELEAKFDVRVGEADILNTKAGLRPLLRPKKITQEDFLSLARRNKVWSSSRAHVTALWGGKYTNSFQMAEEIANQIGVQPSGSVRSVAPRQSGAGMPGSILDARDLVEESLAEACRREMVMTLEDLLRRRTNIAMKIKSGGWGKDRSHAAEMTKL